MLSYKLHQAATSYAISARQLRALAIFLATQIWYVYSQLQKFRRREQKKPLLNNRVPTMIKITTVSGTSELLVKCVGQLHV